MAFSKVVAAVTKGGVRTAVQRAWYLNKGLLMTRLVMEQDPYHAGSPLTDR